MQKLCQPEDKVINLVTSNKLFMIVCQQQSAPFSEISSQRLLFVVMLVVFPKDFFNYIEQLLRLAMKFDRLRDDGRDGDPETCRYLSSGDWRG